MRALTSAELRTISGGDDPTDLGTIYAYANVGWWSGGGGGGGEGGSGLGGSDAEIEEGGFTPIDWTDVATEVKQALCGLAQASQVLDGVLLYGSDGDGVDEVMNILTAASVLLGGGGLVALAARGVLTNGAILGTVATIFGDDIALRLSYAPLGQLASILVGTGVAANAAGDLINALTEGDVPNFCGTTTGHA